MSTLPPITTTAVTVMRQQRLQQQHQNHRSHRVLNNTENKHWIIIIVNSTQRNLRLTAFDTHCITNGLRD